jgi:hypothetical protein
MLPQSDQPCPLDTSELVFLGGWSRGRRGGYGVAYYYCPRCDAGFVYWDTCANHIPVVFTWRRRGDELQLDPLDAGRVSEYLDPDWEVARSNMLHGVCGFLRGRFSEEQGCPNDGGRIPLVAELPCHEGSLVRFYWCRWCSQLFSYLRDEHYGWQCVASFSHDQAEGYKPWGMPRDIPFAELIQERDASLPPPSAFGR